MNKVILFCLFSIFFFSTNAQLKPANIFNNHMVLQRNAPLNIWGWASPGETVTVSINGLSASGVADDKGKWLVTLNAIDAGGPYSLVIKGRNQQKVLKDILIGDVWLCSGQSNMEWVVAQTNNANAAITASANNQIRHVKVAHEISIAPLDDIRTTEWKLASPTATGDFTAVGYYFAQALQKELKVPIGIVNSSWGGSMVETWISKDALQSNEIFQHIAGQIPETEEQYKNFQLAKMKAQLAGFQKEIANEKLDGWEKPQYDDSFWSWLYVPQSWEDQGLAGYDGIMWYRTSVELTQDQLLSDFILELGTIDDRDIVFVNGIKIGETEGWDVKRKYSIPVSILKKGKNTIAVKVFDTGGNGGFYGPSVSVKLHVSDSEIPLSGKWKARAQQNLQVAAMGPNSLPALLFNAMIHPLLPFSLKGINWYQGETNAGRAFQYNTSFPLLIKDWRDKFKNEDLPFNYVQLAAYNANNENGTTGSRWAELREAQLNALSIPNTGMVVSSDVGDANDIHPRNKKAVGERLALIALNKTYQKKLVSSGPLYKSYSIQGNKIKIQFTETGSGLVAAKNNQNILSGFLIAGENHLFRWAKAVIEGNEVVVWNDEIQNPVAVRYGWIDNNASGNLFNKEGLPASPFRTDNWKLISRDIKYVLGQ